MIAVLWRFALIRVRRWLWPTIPPRGIIRENPDEPGYWIADPE
jgi:hypothetical protein